MEHTDPIPISLYRVRTHLDLQRRSSSGTKDQHQALYEPHEKQVPSMPKLDVEEDVALAEA